MARRFRVKYGSEHDSGEAHRSNAAPHFVGVFDTVAALGAKGFRRLAIQAGLAFGSLLLGAAIAIPLAAFIAGIASLVFGLSFWCGLVALIIAGALVGLAIFWRKQRRTLLKTIRDFPNPGDVRSHVAEWKGDNFDRLLSRFVNYARSANAIDETREDFARQLGQH